MATNKLLTKEERQAKKLARAQNRANIATMLAALKGKEIKTLSTKEREDLLTIISDYLGISQSGVIQ